MKRETQKLLEQLATFPPESFECKFSRVSMSLGLGKLLSASELNLLYVAAMRGRLCNIAFNGLGGCGGDIKPERESNRAKLERDFMDARTAIAHSTGWSKMPATQRAAIQRLFLHVSVMDCNLAPEPE